MVFFPFSRNEFQYNDFFLSIIIAPKLSQVDR